MRTSISTAFIAAALLASTSQGAQISRRSDLVIRSPCPTCSSSSSGWSWPWGSSSGGTFGFGGSAGGGADGSAGFGGFGGASGSVSGGASGGAFGGASGSASGSVSWSGSLPSKTCYGAPQKPWQHGSSPGWYLGSSQGCGSLPKWDGGDATFCAYASSPGYKADFCANGNGFGTYPQTSPSCWGISGGMFGWPKPKPTGSSGSSPISSHPSPPKGTPAPICDDGYKQAFSNYTTTPSSGVYSGQVVGAATIDNAHYLTYSLADTVDECLKACDQIAGCTFVNAYHDHLPAGDLASQPKYSSGKLTCSYFSACSGADQATNYGGQEDPSYITDSSGWCKSGSC